MKFQDDQVQTLKACHQPASIAPTIVISNSFNEPHPPKDAAVQPSHVRNSAHAAQQLGTILDPHSREYIVVQLDAQMSHLHLMLQLLPIFYVTLGTFKILFI